ncbi:MAG: hypothetical protein SO274_02305, partial [Turicibacter bilis]|nr:hypothetical protein [Turicibacter bilis]
MAKTKVELQNYQGESLSPITIASNVLYEDGRNAQEVFEEYSNETFTPTIENSSSMFKVGQGDNVDYSSNIVNGAYEGMVLKGKTMVNCIQESSSQDVVLPYEFADGQHVTINDTKESGALSVELKGQTLVNLLNKLTVNADAGQTKNWYAGSYAMGTVKSGKYILFYNVKQTSETNRNTPRIRLADDTYLYHGYDNFNTTTGIKKWIFTANADLLEFSYWITNNTGKVVVDDFILLEYQEGMENWNIPYFTGMASCKRPVLHTVGKNLFDGSISVGGLDIATGEELNNENLLRSDFLEVLKNTTYTNNTNGDYRYFFYDENKNFINSNKGKPFTTPNNCKYIRFHISSIEYTDTLQIEQGSIATSYEPYKSSILSLPEEVVLRSLPNGVCDTFNTRTGVYTQRIGEVVLDGSDSVNDWMFNESNNTFRTSFNKHGIIPFQSNTFVHVISDKYTTLVYADDWNSGAFVSMDTYNRVVFRDDRFSSLIDWHNSLKQNAITVQYILETPVVTKINLSSTLKSWNTTTHIYSEIPENTLYPTLSHSNPTYPVILKPSTKYSIVASSYGNDHTNSAINFNLGGTTASTTVGNRVATITTPSTLSNELLTMSGRGNKLNNVMVIEGDVVGDEPYFEGICDCKSPILSNVGKNLFDYKNYGKQDINIVEIENGLRVSTWATSLPFINNLLPNTKYTSKSVVKIVEEQVGATDIGAGKIYIYNGTNYFLLFKPDGDKYVFTTPSDIKSYNRILFYAHGGGGSKVGVVDITNMQLEETSSATTYEPYKSNTTTFDQKDGKTIVLRSLPNGVYDTLNVETGEYVQRIGEVVLDGSETWETSNWETNSHFAFRTGVITDVINIRWGDRRTLMGCDILPVVVASDQAMTLSSDFITLVDGRKFIVKLSKEKLTGGTVDNFKQWLQQNPITVQYQLETPIVSTVDIQGFPYAYTNGHVILSSGSIEQSLTPKVEYSVVTNRNGQIRSNQKMVERHQKQLDRLQAMILTNLVNTQYEQTLTNLKYDLKNVREEVK